MNTSDQNLQPAAEPQESASTERQRESARINGAKSHGPITPEGKAISARNSLRHGILAKTILLEGESLEHFQSFIRHLEDAFSPVGPIEDSFVETMALSKWRQMRIVGMEKAGIHHQIKAGHEARAEQSGPSGVTPLDPATTAYLAFTTINQQNRTLELMNRYETRCDRQYERALSRLFAAQRRRKGARIGGQEGGEAC
jgi:hypothetical protein